MNGVCFVFRMLLSALLAGFKSSMMLSKLFLLHLLSAGSECWKQCVFNCLFSPVLRQPTQDAPEEVRARDFRRELEERERVAAREKTRERGPRGWFFCRY